MNTILWGLMLSGGLVAALCAGSVWMFLPVLFLLLFPVVSILCLLPGRKKIHLELIAPVISQKNKNTVITADIRKMGKILPGRLILVLRIKNCLTGETDTLRWRPMRDRELTLESRFCGCLEAEVVKAFESDWMGVLYLPIACDKKKRILIMPDTFPVLMSDRMSVSSQDDCEDYSQLKKGNDRTETFQNREYVPGDPLNLIHWKLSGKRGNLIVREPALPIDRSLVVFLHMADGEILPKEADALTEAAASVCRALTDAGITFHFSWSSDVMRLCEVTSLEQFSEALADFLKDQTAITAKGKGLSALTEETGEKISGRVLYFAKELPEDEDFLDRMYEMQYFICGPVSGADGHCLTFTAENPEEAFGLEVL